MQTAPAFDQARDILLDDAEGETRLIWYVDYACSDTRRIRDVMIRTVERFGRGSAALAVRLLPAQGKGDGAELAARAALAAHRQGRFRDMHRALFGLKPPFSEAMVHEAATTIGLDMARFATDLNDATTHARLADDRSGLPDTAKTPMLFIDGRAYEGAWDETSLIEAVEKPLGVRLQIASNDFFHWAASAGLVLVLATICALVIANIGFHEAYEHLRHTLAGVTFGAASFELSLEVWINDGLMALFFLLVGIEIKREIVDGELSDPSRAALPIIGAIGGMLVPALIYAGINWGTDTVHGWGVPMATDIAFTLGIMALLGDRVPTSLKVFVSALAIADDLGAILVIALFYGHGFHLGALVVAIVVFAVMIGLNISRIYARTPYLLLGVVLWYFVFQSGLHATVAGVLTAAAIPSRRAANVQGVAAQTAAVFAAEIGRKATTIGDAALRRIQTAVDRLREPGYHLQHALESWSNFLILPLFAFFNTGILIIGSSFRATDPEVLGVMAGLVIGKPLGIALAVYVAVRLGFAKLSSEISWGQIVGAGCLAGVGFTMSIFIASSAFDGAQLDSVKLATLVGSTIAAILGVCILMQTGRRKTDSYDTTNTLHPEASGAAGR